MTLRRLVLGSLVSLAWLVAPGLRAQVPFVGIMARDNCTRLGVDDHHATRPALVGLHWQSLPRNPSQVDVIYSQRWDPTVGWSGLPWWNASIDSAGWGIAPNWRREQLPSSITDVIVLQRGELWYDSADLSDPNMDMVEVQPIGVLDGEAPEVTVASDRHRIRFRPVREVAPTVAGCALAGDAPRGAFTAYVVWSVPAASFPSPTPTDFFLSGQRHVVDLATLDFNVADADGFGGSDLDPIDGAVLINPDGLPDTGDEVIDLLVCPEGGAARWYSVQPAVMGDFEYFDGGPVSRISSPSGVVNVTGGPSPDVTDVRLDGAWEFTDACGLGLGLVWENAPATSLLPGLGSGVGIGCGPPPDCDRGQRNGIMSVRPREPSAVDLRNVTPLTVRRQDMTSLVVGWEDTLGGKYSLYVGDLEVLFRTHEYSHVPAIPCSHPAPVATIDMPPGNVYFVATAWEMGYESSYGRDSEGDERPPADTPCP